MRITSDWHTHTQHSPCGNPATTLESLWSGMRGAGLSRGGVTDHLFSQANLPALAQCRQAYDAMPEREGFHFAVEASCLREYDVARNRALGLEAPIYGMWEEGPEGPLTVYFPEEEMAELGVEYVIGGAHFAAGAPLEREAIIRSYHRQNMCLAQHPRIDIIAHPWWWQGAWKEADGIYHTLPWFDDFGCIPRSLHEEFAAAAREGGKRVEINLGATLGNDQYPPSFRPQYLEYLAFLREAGVRFSIASDSHAAGYGGGLDSLEEDLASIGLSEGDLWAGPE